MSTQPDIEQLTPEERRRLLAELLAQQSQAGESFPLSFAQQRLWFLDQLAPGGAQYNISAAMRLQGSLHTAALERALNELRRRHESLRTVFRGGGAEEPVQVVFPPRDVPLPVEEMDGLPAADREPAVREAVRANAEHPFDLSSGPLFRATLLRLSAREHVLMLCMHHIISDGWSMGVLFRELSALYGAFARERESPLEELEIQYADYAVWQREHLQGELLERELSWWREQLRGAPTLLELPADRPRRAEQSHRGAVCSELYESALRDALQALARREGATMYMVLLAAFQVLLSRYSGHEDVVVGTPIAGRTRGELEPVVGFFVNTLALRTDLSGRPTFRQLLARVREATLQAYAHQELPFEKLIEELKVERGLGHNPLFQVMLVLQNNADARLQLDGVEVEVLPGGMQSAAFDLTCRLREEQGGLRAAIEYATDRFDAATIERLSTHFRRLLEAASADPEQRIDDLPLLPDAERHTLLQAWNATEAPHPPCCLHELFEDQARGAPAAVAVACGDARLTYAELDARANRLAHHLRRRGVGAEVRVGLCLERSVEMVVALLAVLKAGGAYVPLDPASPPERLSRMLDDVGAALVLVHDRLRGRIPPRRGTPVLAIEDALNEAAGERTEKPAAGVEPGHLAYVIYTSGSTGTPKGVGVQHAALVNHMRWCVREFGIGSDDRVLQRGPLVFDGSAWELYAPLAAGATLVLARHGEDGDPRALARRIRKAGVTVLHLVPSLYTAMLDEPEMGGCTSLRQVFCGGEALPGETARQHAGMFPGARLVNVYGPTECAIVSTWHLCREEDAARPVVPIGRPGDNTRCYVLDGTLRPSPIGVPGELFIGGAQVARGYVGRPALTAKAFVPDPFSSAPGARLYRTGDRARWSAEGVLEFLGRVDHQVKIRGFRIELGEIESVLARHPAVRECVVLAREHAPGETRLVAYVTASQAAQVEVEELRRHLQERLPEYMMPAAFVPLEAMPTTPTGKVDRKALPAPAWEADGGEHVEPRTAAEEILCGIWAEVLGAGVGVHENFFALGGHSLLATRVVSRARQAFGTDVPLRALFSHPTIAELAREVERLKHGGAPDAVEPIPLAPRDEPLPLSFAQQRLWFLDRYERDSVFYSMPFAWRLRGALDVALLGRCADALVRRHESLRTVFRTEDEGEPVQVILRARPSVLAVEDLAEGADREERVWRRVREEAERPFDLATGPLFRMRLLRLAPEEHVLLLSMHHIVSDGWSMGVLFRELAALYAAGRRGGDAPLPELEVQYADYACWQRGHLRGARLDRELEYWRERLRGAPALLELATDHPRPPRQSFAGAARTTVYDPALRDALQALARREGATLYMVLLAAFQVLLGRYSGQEDVVVGSPIAGRTRPEVEGLVGFFANTLALRTDLSGNPTFGAVLARVREATLEAYAHQELPFEKLVEELRPERSLGHSPVFQVMFSLQNNARVRLGLEGVEVQVLGSGTDTAKFDLTLSMMDDAEGLRAGLEYRTDLFRSDTIDRMLEHFRVLLEAIARQPHQCIAELPLLPAAERGRLLSEWNRTAAAVPRRCIDELVQEQAARTPSAVAVVHGDARLTYGQLEARANQLANRLRRLGVRPEARVGICLERGLELPVALLGVLKAGGAYVPLDPGYPAERLAFMLADSAPRVLLTQQSLLGALPEHGAQVVALDADGGSIAREPELGPWSGATPESLAYVIYTSGSTGQPKGVMLEQGSLANLLHWQRGAGRAPRGARTLQFSPTSFDVSFQEIFATWLEGGTLVMISDEDRRDGRALLARLREHQVERLFLPFVALRSLAEAGETDGAPLPLREVVTAGEQLKVTDEVRNFFETIPHCALVNQYGPTETHVVTHHALAGASAAWSSLPPIGRPIANARVYVLDRQGAPVPAGVPGELYLGGAGVARGYLNRPALTAARFVPDPFGPKAGARLYRTGDRARWTADGELEFLGRTDHQVKVRGFRIEPGEIEGVLAQHPWVRECVVVVREDAPGNGRLVAYVAASEPGLPDVAPLREHLRARLPDYMIPSAFVPLEALPLTPSGKVDRRALPAPGWQPAEEAHVAPRTPVEEVLCGIWAEVLGLDRVGVHDDFFELGGHSLLATRVISRIRRALAAEVPLRMLFEAPTVAAFAPIVASSGEAGDGEAAREETAWADADDLSSAIHALSDEEVDQLLQQLESVEGNG